MGEEGIKNCQNKIRRILWTVPKSDACCTNVQRWGRVGVENLVTSLIFL